MISVNEIKKKETESNIHFENVFEYEMSFEIERHFLSDSLNGSLHAVSVALKQSACDWYIFGRGFSS